MKSMRLLIVAILAGLAALGWQSCISDSFTTSPNDILAFSADTLSFDTVFTDLGTPTARLKVYNRASKSINIASIRFRQSDSPFTLNVDGQSGTVFSNVEIRPNDSIFLFVECYIAETAGNTPFLVEDMLDFVTNGVSQSVVVEAYGQNVTRLRGERVTGTLQLNADRPYVVYDSLVVDDGGVLRAAPGTRLLFHDGARLTVRGTLEAVGTPSAPVEMRGDRLDNVLPDVGYDILAGQWDGVVIGPGSFGNRMEYVDMRSTVRGVQVDSCGVTDRPKLTLVNSWLHNSQGTVLSSRYARVDAYGVCFSEAGGPVVELWGGVHEFSQCTISNYYLFAVPSGPLLTLRHCLPAAEGEKPVSDLPLMSAVFENSIIYGMTSDINTGDLTGSDVYLRNVLMKSSGENDEHFIDCLWDKDPLFYTVRTDYIFNYHVKDDSPAIGAGNPEYVSPLTETDMDGRRRQTPPTLGAYVYVPEPE